MCGATSPAVQEHVRSLLDAQVVEVVVQAGDWPHSLPEVEAPVAAEVAKVVRTWCFRCLRWQNCPACVSSRRAEAEVVAVAAEAARRR